MGKRQLSVPRQLWQVCKNTLMSDNGMSYFFPGQKGPFQLLHCSSLSEQMLLGLKDSTPLLSTQSCNARAWEPQLMHLHIKPLDSSITFLTCGAGRTVIQVQTHTVKTLFDYYPSIAISGGLLGFLRPGHNTTTKLSCTSALAWNLYHN